MYSTYEDLGKDPNQPNQQTMKNVTELQDEEHKRNVISSNKLVVVDVYANWCSPCKVVEPRFSQLAKQYETPSLCALVKENIENPKLNTKIKGVPTFLFFIDGNYVDSIVGADIVQVEENIKLFLGKAKHN